ncbi:hypothetical protein [Bradyrhizobium sp. UFLA05-112]
MPMTTGIVEPMTGPARPLVADHVKPISIAPAERTDEHRHTQGVRPYRNAGLIDENFSGLAHGEPAPPVRRLQRRRSARHEQALPIEFEHVEAWMALHEPFHRHVNVVLILF